MSVEGVLVEGNQAQLLLDDDEVLSVPAELLLQAVGGEATDLERLTEGGSVQLKISRRGSDVIEIIRQ